MNFDLDPWHLWTICAVVLLIGEVFVPGFILASLGLGAILAAITHQMSGEFGWGLAGFATGAAASLFLIRPFIARALGPEQQSRFGADGMVGDVIVISDADDIGGTAKAHYRDTTWSLRSDFALCEGDRVEIIGVDGGVLIVKPTSVQGN